MVFFREKRYKQSEVQTLIKQESAKAVQAAMKNRTIKAPVRRGGILGRTAFGRGAHKIDPLMLYLDIWRRHPWVRAAVEKTAKIAMLLNFEIVESEDCKEEGRHGDPEERQILKRFFKDPNERQSFPEVMYFCLSRMRLTNEAFLEVTKNVLHEPVDYYTLEGKIKINVDEHGNFLKPAYTQKVSGIGGEVLLQKDEVIHIKMPDPIGGVRSEPPLKALELSVLTDFKAMILLKSFITNPARVTKLFLMPEGLSDDTVKRNRAEIYSLYSNATEAFTPALALEGNVEVKDMQPEKMGEDFEEKRKGLMREMLAVLDTPASKIAGGEGIPKAGLQEIDKAFYKESVLPLLQMIALKFNHFIRTQFSVYDWEFRFRLQPIQSWTLRDMARMIDVLAKYRGIRLNEARKFATLPILTEEEGGEEFLKPIERAEQKGEAPELEGLEAEDFFDKLTDLGHSPEDIAEIFNQWIANNGDSLEPSSELAFKFTKNRSLDEIADALEESIHKDLSFVQKKVEKKTRELFRARGE